MAGSWLNVTQRASTSRNQTQTYHRWISSPSFQVLRHFPCWNLTIAQYLGSHKLLAIQWGGCLALTSNHSKRRLANEAHGLGVAGAFLSEIPPWGPHKSLPSLATHGPCICGTWQPDVPKKSIQWGKLVLNCRCVSLVFPSQLLELLVVSGPQLWLALRSWLARTGPRKWVHPTN